MLDKLNPGATTKECIELLGKPYVLKGSRYACWHFNDGSKVKITLDEFDDGMSIPVWEHVF